MSRSFAVIIPSLSDCFELWHVEKHRQGNHPSSMPNFMWYSLRALQFWHPHYAILYRLSPYPFIVLDGDNMIRHSSLQHKPVPVPVFFVVVVVDGVVVVVVVVDVVADPVMSSRWPIKQSKPHLSGCYCCWEIWEVVSWLVINCQAGLLPCGLIAKRFYRQAGSLGSKLPTSSVSRSRLGHAYWLKCGHSASTRTWLWETRNIITRKLITKGKAVP